MGEIITRFGSSTPASRIGENRALVMREWPLAVRRQRAARAGGFRFAAAEATVKARSERLQSALDLGAPRLEERRQREALAEPVQRLVGGEARTVGGDLEQD